MKFIGFSQVSSRPYAVCGTWPSISLNRLSAGKFMNCGYRSLRMLILNKYMIMKITCNHICTYSMLSKFTRERCRQSYRIQAGVHV